MNRRRFLKGLALSGAGLGVTGVGLRSVMARADAEAPRRLLVISHCQGWPYESWRLQPAGFDTTVPWELPLAELAPDALSQPLAPLYAHRTRILALDGLSLATAELDMDGNRHDRGWVHAWTGSWADFSNAETRSTSQSLDQLVAAAIARPDRLPSLELAVDAGLETGRPISYASTGTRLPVLNTPERAWQRLFGPSSGDAALVARQRDVLDYAYGEYQATAPLLGGLQRQRLESHFELLHRLGNRLEGLANLACGNVPELAATMETYDARFDAFSDLIAAAFSCDVSRVATLSLGEMPSADIGWDHLSDDVHKGIAHEVYSDPEKHQAMTDYLTRHAEQVARLVSLLEATPDVDGGSVMDNTLIVWGSELGNGWHGYQQYCPILIGGSWHFQTGRYLHWPHETPIQIMVPATISPGGYTQFSGRPHQHLLVSVAQAMGLDVHQVGLDAVQGQTGERVLCSGPLPGLT